MDRFAAEARLDGPYFYCKQEQMLQVAMMLAPVADLSLQACGRTPGPPTCPEMHPVGYPCHSLLPCRSINACNQPRGLSCCWACACMCGNHAALLLDGSACRRVRDWAGCEAACCCKRV